MKKFFTLIAVAVMAFAAQADVLTVCDGTETNSNLPIYGLYADVEGTMGQMIYSADMLQDMVGGKITQVKFFSPDIRFSNAVLQLSLKDGVSQENYDDYVAVQDMNAVAQATPEKGATEMVFNLDEPFTYEGGNLVVEVKVITAGSYATTYFYGESTPYYVGYQEYTSLYSGLSKYHVAFLPKAEFTYEFNVVPMPTPEAPVITWTAENGVLTITATGEGFVMLEVGEGISRTGMDEASYTMQYDPEVGVTVEARACIWAEGAPASDYTNATIVVEPEGTVEPTDPHMQGKWLVVIDMFGNHNWFQLTQGANDDSATTVALEYSTYGLYDPDNVADVPFYFVVDGVQYGAEGAMTPAVIGQAMENPLFESEEYYTVPVGYSYALGIAIINNEYYAYVSQAYPTSVDELNAGKTVAGVRYFNMAGQEMQEANGMTIVVTTYTDGTTSAAKVMK